MLIAFMISGGVAGAVKGCRIDTLALPAADRRELESLAEAAGIAGTQEAFAAAGRDLRQFGIVIDRDGVSACLLCDERSVPDRARPLVTALMARATPQPLSFAAAFPSASPPDDDHG